MRHSPQRRSRHARSAWLPYDHLGRPSGMDLGQHLRIKMTFSDRIADLLPGRHNPQPSVQSALHGCSTDREMGNAVVGRRGSWSCICTEPLRSCSSRLLKIVRYSRPFITASLPELYTRGSGRLSLSLLSLGSDTPRRCCLFTLS